MVEQLVPSSALFIFRGGVIKMPGIIDWLRSRGFCLSLILLCITLLSSGCGDDQQGRLSNGSDDTASANLTIRWYDTPVVQNLATIGRAASLDCQAGGVEQVVCEVYDVAGNLLVTGGPWACEARSGRVERIPVGQDRVFVILGEDDLGNIRYQGETTGVSIAAGQNTQTVVIDAYPFIPTLSFPENAAEGVDLEAVSLEWEVVENADEYLVEVAKDDDFETIVIDETTPATVYAAPPLEPLTEYFWKIRAVDMQANIGAYSEARSFVTSDCTNAISPTSQLVDRDGGLYDVTISTTQSGCEWSTSENKSWISLSPPSGSGSGTVRVTVLANPGVARKATITIAGQTHTINQEEARCTYSISPTSQLVDEDGGFYDVTVSATHNGCDWSTSESVSWLSLSPTSGSGSGTVRVIYLSNSGAARSATMTIAGETHGIIQEGDDDRP